MERGRGLLVCCIVLALIATACGTPREPPAASSTPLTSSAGGRTVSSAATSGSSATGRCRSQLARAQAAGTAIPEWVSLATELTMSGDVEGPVIEATDVTDLGQDTPAPREGLQEPGRLVRFEGVTPLRGQLATDLPMLMSRYALADANVDVQRGTQLLARIDPKEHDGR